MFTWSPKVLNSTFLYFFNIKLKHFCPYKMFLVNKIFGEEAEEKVDYEEGPKPLTLPDVAEYIQKLYLRNFSNAR